MFSGLSLKDVLFVVVSPINITGNVFVDNTDKSVSVVTTWTGVNDSLSPQQDDSMGMSVSSVRRVGPSTTQNSIKSTSVTIYRWTDNE